MTEAKGVKGVTKVMDLPRFRGRLRAWESGYSVCWHFVLFVGFILLFSARRSHSSVPRRGALWPSRVAAVKDGRCADDRNCFIALRPLLDGRKRGGRLASVGIVSFLFIGDRRKVTERGMAAAGIVEALDEGEDGHAGFGSCREPMPIEKLAFEGRKETLAHGIVEAITD